MTYKVFFDTNILISTSLLATSEKFDISIKHRFYTISIRLINFVKRNKAMKLAIITSFIEEEAYQAISHAVNSQLKEEDFNVVEGSEAFSAILNICDSNLRELLEFFCIKDVDETTVSVIRKEVDNMYDDLMKTAATLPFDAPAKANMVWKRVKRAAFEIYKRQEIHQNEQLLRLIGRRPGRTALEDSDRVILSHVTYLLRHYLKTVGAPFRMFLASCDYHFSPIRRGAFISDQVTSDIDHFLGIECDFPDKIYEIVRHMPL